MLSSSRMTGKKKSTQPKAPMGARKSVSIAAARQSAYKRTYFRTLRGRSDGSVRVQGRELLSRITTSQSFVLVSDNSVNPQNQSLFPRLSTLASAFEQFSFKSGRLKIMYESACPSSTPGTILMYHDYDITSAAAVDPLSVLNHEVSVESAIWSPCCLTADISKQMLDKLFVDQPVGPTVSSPSELAALRQGYLGAVRVYTSDGPVSNVFAGYLFVEYDLELYTPRVPIPVALIASGVPKTISGGGQYITPLQSIKQRDGINPQNAVATTNSYKAGGGIAGALDAAKTLYEAGEYVFNLLSIWTAAVAYETLQPNRTVSGYNFVAQGEQKASPVARILCKDELEDLRKSIEFDKSIGNGIQETYTVRYSEGPGGPEEAKALKKVQLVSGDIVNWLVTYDVTDGYINPDFPMSSSGMTPLSYQQYGYSGTGAYPFLGTSFKPVVVPPGKKYLFLVYSDTGPLTSRSVLEYTLDITAKERAQPGTL